MEKRKRLTITLDSKIIEKLKDINREKYIPISRIVEIAIREKLKWKKKKEIKGAYS